jgi:hypothetical protein
MSGEVDPSFPYLRKKPLPRAVKEIGSSCCLTGLGNIVWNLVRSGEGGDSARLSESDKKATRSIVVSNVNIR